MARRPLAPPTAPAPALPPGQASPGGSQGSPGAPAPAPPHPRAGEPVPVAKRPGPGGAARGVMGAYVDGLSVVLLHREADGTLNHRTTRAQYVSYHTRQDLELCEPDVMEQLRHSRAVVGIADEDRWFRIQWRDWESREKGVQWLASEHVVAYEADLNPVRRYFADSGEATCPNPRVAYLDIETDSRVSFANKEEMRLLCWCVKDMEGNTTRGMLEHDTDADEARLLRELWKALEPYDVVAAWYGDGFDFVVVHARTKARRLLVDVRRWRWLDQLEVYKSLNAHVAESGDEKQSMSLQAVATALLGEGKKDFDAGNTWEAWSAGGESRARLLEYNEHDVALQVGIERKTQYIKLFSTLCAACRLFVETHSLHASTQMDGYMLRLGKLRGHHFPTKPGRDSLHHHEKFKGAYVMAPKTHGIAKDVHVADFAGLYPSIMISWNMSPETYVGDIPEEETCICPLTNARFATGRTGILTEALLELRALRKQWVDKKASLPPGTEEWHDADRWSMAFKVLANSFYGVTGLSYGRFYNPRISEGVTQNGAWLIRETIKEAEKRGMRAVYCDTDSVFVEGVAREEFEAFVQWCNADLYPRLLKGVGCRRNYISLAYEKQFERVVFCAAKKYCNPPEAPIWMGDLTFKPLGEVQVGDYVIGWEDGVGENSRRRLVRSQVVAVHQHHAPIVKLKMASGRTIRCTPDHRWLTNRSSGNCQFVTPKVARTLVHVISEPSRLPTIESELNAAWLGGIFDGEGSMCSGSRSQITITQSPKVNAEICSRIEQTLTDLGFTFSIRKVQGDCNWYAVHTDKQKRLNFLRWCRPSKTKLLNASILKSRFGESDRIMSIRGDGHGPVIGLTTTTGNYIAWGYASKNCGRYSHYKGKEATEDSKPEVRGMEFKRGDSMLLARKLQGDLIELLMRKRCEDPEQVQEVVRRHLRHTMEDALTLADVVLGQSLQKPLDEYEGPNEKGVDSSPPHVRVARVLRARGQDVSVGTKVAFIITDANVSPMGVIPAQDWNGEVDRWGIWEQRVWPPSERLLTAAFPDVDWSEFSKVRPKEPRAKCGAPKGDAPQLGLFDRKGSVLDLEADSAKGFDERAVKAVRAILDLAPEGNTQVRLRLKLPAGEVTLAIERTIDPRADVVKRLRSLLGTKAVNVT